MPHADLKIRRGIEPHRILPRQENARDCPHALTDATTNVQPLVEYWGVLYTIERDIEFVYFLYHYYRNLKNEEEQANLRNILENIRFLYAEDNDLDKPANLFFPSAYRSIESVAKGAKVLHPELFRVLNQDSDIIEWLHEIGLSDMDALSIIDKLICKPGFITEENAIDVGDFLFNTWRNHSFTKLSYYSLDRLEFLNKAGSLCRAEELYLGSCYFPTFDLEPTCPPELIVSDKYCAGASDTIKREWHRFFTEVGIEDTVAVRQLKFDKRSKVYDYLESYVKFAEKHEYNDSALTGKSYYMSFLYFQVKYVPYIGIENSSIDFSKTIWSCVLKEPVSLDRYDDYIYGTTGYGHVKSAYLSDKSPEHDYLGKNFLPWMIEHYQTFPSSTGEMLKTSELFSNLPYIKQLFGNYLPYIDVDCEIDESWNDILKLKCVPTLEDYLLLLSKISLDTEQADENKERISTIYQRIVEDFNMDNQSNTVKIQEWSQNNTILSQDGIFKKPSDLRYISFDGFGKSNRVFVGKSDSREKVLSLLSKMGVTIVTESSITTMFSDKNEKDEIKKCLQNKAKVLALLKSGENPSKELFNEALASIQKQLADTHFYHCSKITLTYGRDDDTIDKVTFGQGNCFYYTGELRISKVDPLLTPLCKYLKIKGKERELLITMFEGNASIIEYLNEKEYNTDYIIDIPDDSSHTFSTSLTLSRSESDKRRDARTGYLGEIVVYEKLISMGYKPECPSLSDSTDFEEIIDYKGKSYYCKPNYGRYDISFTSMNGTEMLVEVKATTVSKNVQENMPISYREISMVEECNLEDNRCYLIARVFNVKSDNPEIFVFKGHLLDN